MGGTVSGWECKIMFHVTEVKNNNKCTIYLTYVLDEIRYQVQVIGIKLSWNSALLSSFLYKCDKHWVWHTKKQSEMWITRTVWQHYKKGCAPNDTKVYFLTNIMGLSLFVGFESTFRHCKIHHLDSSKSQVNLQYEMENSLRADCWCSWVVSCREHN